MRESQKKEDTCARNVRKVAECCVFPMICGSVGWKSRFSRGVGAGACRQNRNKKIARRCGAKRIFKSKCRKHITFGPLLEVQMLKNCMPPWRETHFQVKMYKTHHVRTTFGSSDITKLHAVVARIAFATLNDEK